MGHRNVDVKIPMLSSVSIIFDAKTLSASSGSLTDTHRFSLSRLRREKNEGMQDKTLACTQRHINVHNATP